MLLLRDDKNRLLQLFSKYKFGYRNQVFEIIQY